MKNDGMNSMGTCPVCGRGMGRTAGTFGSRLRKAMDDKGIVTSTLAEWLDITPGSVSNYRNDSNYPAALTLAKMAKLLGVSVDWLMFGDDDGWTGESVLNLITSSGCGYEKVDDGYIMLIDSNQLGAIADKLNDMEAE